MQFLGVFVNLDLVPEERGAAEDEEGLDVGDAERFDVATVTEHITQNEDDGDEDNCQDDFAKSHGG